MRDDTLARGMYEAYGKSVGFKNFQGNPMPEWEALPRAIQDAWYAAGEYARTVVEADGNYGD